MGLFNITNGSVQVPRRSLEKKAIRSYPLCAQSQDLGIQTAQCHPQVPASLSPRQGPQARLQEKAGIRDLQNPHPQRWPQEKRAERLRLRKAPQLRSHEQDQEAQNTQVHLRGACWPQVL